MPYKRKRLSRSTRRPRRKASRRKNPTMKMVKRVAASQALRMAETKRFAILNEVYSPAPPTNGSTQWYYRNIFAPLDQGFSSWRVVGSEIQRPYLKIKGRFEIWWDRIIADNPLNYGYVSCHVMLVAANDALANTTPSSYGLSSSSLNWFYQIDAQNPTMNGNNVKVLKKWSKVIRAQQVASGTVAYGRTLVNMSLKYRWKRRLTFEDSGAIPDTGGPTSARILRGWNYYILVGYGLGNNLGNVTNFGWPYIRLDSFLYYKDP